MTRSFPSGRSCLTVRPPVARFALALGGALFLHTHLALANPVQPMPREIKGQREYTPPPALDTAPTKPMMNMRMQQSRAWKQALVNNMRATTVFMAENKAMPHVKTLKSGVQFKVIKAGKGARPKPDDTIGVLYQGKLVDGTVFVSEKNADHPASLVTKNLVAGFGEALLRMRIGSKWQIIVPPDLGYGDEGIPPTIGPGAALIYDVEVVSINGSTTPAPILAKDDSEHGEASP